MSLLSRVLSFLLRVIVVLAGLVFAASVLVAGVVVALVFVLRNLLTGKRPTAVRWRTGYGPRMNAHWFRHAAAQRTAAARNPADVVDVEAREVPASQRHLPPQA